MASPPTDDSQTATSRGLTRRRWQSRILLVVLTAAIVAVGGSLVELAAFRVRAQRTYQEARRNPPHPFLQVLPSTRADGVNEHGFRGDAITRARSAGEVRIFALGGSTTYGVTNTFADSYPQILQQLLRARHPGVPIHVQNAGAPWHTTAHALASYELRVRQFDPDIVLYFEAINDLVRSFSPPWYAVGDFRPDYAHYLGPYTRLTRIDAEFLHPTGWLSWDIVRAWLFHEPTPFNHRDPANVKALAARMRAVDNPPFRALPSYRDFYGRLLQAVSRDGRVFLGGSQPFFYRADLAGQDLDRLFFGPLMCADRDGTYPSLAGMRQGMEHFNQAAREVVMGRGAVFLDFEQVVPKTATYFADDVHLNRAGNERIAALIADHIDAQGLVAQALGRARTGVGELPAVPRPRR
jgi:lysophospholipase L1-like esterase